MNEENKINLYQKLQKCRVEVQEAGIKMSGKNKFSNYEYIELSDILPSINKAMDKYQLTSLFHFTREEATLKIVNSENTEEFEVFPTPVSITPLKGCNEMQNIGAAQRYARRYLYFMAFEIVEHDMLDSGENSEDEEAVQRNAKIDINKIETINSMLNKTNSDKKIFLEYYKIKKVEDMTNGIFVGAIKKLDEKLEKTKKQHPDEIDLGI